MRTLYHGIVPSEDTPCRADFPLYDPDRLNAFSDGVFAIAATLLVLQIALPDAATVEKHGLAQGLSDANFVSNVITFVLSFLIVTIYRGAHQHLFNRIERTDGVISRLNTLFLLCIAFLPFTTTLFSNYAYELSFVIYAGTLAAAGIMLLSINLYASTKADLMPPSQRSASKMIIRDAAPPVVFLLSIPLSYVIGPRNAALSWILIAFAEQVLRLVLGKDEEATEAQPATVTRGVVDEADQAHPS